VNFLLTEDLIFAVIFAKKDREIHIDTYPQLFYNELYVLEGGYKKFYECYPLLCEPVQYIAMLDLRFEKERKANMNIARLQGGSMSFKNTKTVKRSWSTGCIVLKQKSELCNNNGTCSSDLDSERENSQNCKETLLDLSLNPNFNSNSSNSLQTSSANSVTIAINEFHHNKQYRHSADAVELSHIGRAALKSSSFDIAESDLQRHYFNEIHGHTNDIVKPSLIATTLSSSTASNVVTVLPTINFTITNPNTIVETSIQNQQQLDMDV